MLFTKEGPLCATDGLVEMRVGFTVEGMPRASKMLNRGGHYLTGSFQR